MTRIQKLKYIKVHYGVTYTFIAKNIGTTYNRLYRYTLPKDDENYRRLNSSVIERLDNYLNKFTYDY